MYRVDLPDELLALARRTHGALRTADLQAAGLGTATISRRVDAGQLERVAHGLYVVSALQDRLSTSAALQLACPATVASGASAATIWRLDGYASVSPGALDITPGRRSRRTPQNRRRRLSPDDVVIRDGLRVTTVERTLADLAATEHPDLVELAIESALRENITNEEILRTGPPALQDVLARRRLGDPPTGSYAETRLLQKVVRRVGLEDPERQVPITVPGRRVPYVRDFVFTRPRGELDVEIDGSTVHGTPAAHQHDIVRDTLISEAGNLVRRFAARRVDHRPSAVGRDLIAALRMLE